MWRKKRYIIPAVIVLVVIIARLLLPYFVLRSVNRTLDNIPGYEGNVEDIDIALYRGAYVIHELTLWKENAVSSTPLLFFPKSDVSIEWSSLWRGKVVSEIVLHQPVLNYVFEDQEKPVPEGEPQIEDWTKALTDLVPIEINHLQVHGGRINFIQFSANPDIDLVMSQIELQATNLRNVIQTEMALPSSVHATAVSFGGGQVVLTGRTNVMKRIPDMDMEFSLMKADVTALNEMTLHTAGVDFESGTFELYSEVAIADGYLKGYLKPMFIDTKLLGQEDQGFFEKLWEGFVGVFKFLFKNQGTDTLATRAPIEGDLNNLDTGLFATIVNIFKNAWIQAFTTEVDEDIEFEDARREKKD